MRDSTHPAFAKATPRNWQILAVLEEVAKAVERPVAEVALSWAVNRPGVASVIVGATRLDQLEANVRALDLTLPPELTAKLYDASTPPSTYPYVFFEGELQAMVHGGVEVAAKPAGYTRTARR